MSPFDNEPVDRPTNRNISWIKAARKEFEEFPVDVQDNMMDALTKVADGVKPLIAKPMKGLGTGVFEIALRSRGDAYRTVYTIQFQDNIWVVHAFMKKSKTGIKTPQFEIDLVRERIRRLKEILL